MRFTTRNQVKVDEENPYWISFSDLMSALLVIFILAAVALIIELTQRTQDIDAGIEELKKAEQARQDILTEVREELAKQNIKVEIADNETVIRIPEETLSFKSGEDLIPEEMTDSVKNIGIILHSAILKNQRFKYLNTVFVEGHTDSVPIKRGKYWTKGNWGLSADRAITVWKLWSEELVLEPNLNELLNHSEEKLFSVSGYAATRRVELDESTPELKAKNRRIDIRFTVKRPSIEDLEKIKPNYSKS
ncbi:OmpA family protein [Psychrosphaera sp. 1_MG-2023]|uniref:OmpA/MotB family protein n=1 Tax=Psychrosphaera sp. 1_MG-2023 TaxID=3062643 RepID=UPI0026E33143|nr:OmpA family protein [Psychrosphaera sp. 1_MG-2023]MDO6718706.1 OmpA family protein [Psychrosphaera sp. 1_MG-2023]